MDNDGSKTSSGDRESRIQSVLSSIAPNSPLSRRICSYIDHMGTAANEKCSIEEVSDTHGFSLVDSYRVHSTDVLRSFQRDSNWNNPGAVELMCNAFSIQDDYDSFILGPSQAGATYLDLRGQYNHMVATRFLEQGISLRNKGSFVESCKNLDNAIRLDPTWADAYMERGGVKALLGRKDEALRDYDDAVRLQPDNALARAEAQILRASLRQSTVNGYRATPPTGTTVGSSSSGALPRLEPGRLSLIGKLQRSIEDRHNKAATDDGNSDDSSSVDTSSSSNSSNSSASSNQTGEKRSRSHKRKKGTSERDSKHRHKEKKHRKRKKDHKKSSRHRSRHSSKSKKRRRRESDES